VLVAEVARAYLRTFDSKSPADAIYKKLTGLHGLVPRTIIFVKTGGVPCTPNGKLNRQAGRQAFLSHELPILGEWKRTTPATQYRQTPDVSDGSPAAWLIQRIADRLGVDPAEVPMDQPFATLGCDSLDLIEIAEELSEHSGIEIDPVVMWEYPTIAELTFHLSKASQLCAVETGDVQPALLTDSAGNAMVR
jgi:acyl carrier protein